MRTDDAPIASPCDEDWERMRLDPDGRTRFCDQCQKSVHDLSAMGPRAARAFIAGAREPVCISYLSDGRGELVFARPRDQLVPVGRLGRAAALVATLAACTPHDVEAEVSVVEEQQAPGPGLTVPPVIPDAPPPTTPRPADPQQVDEPCEPHSPERPRVKGRLRKTAGVYLPPSDGPLD